MEQPLTRGLAGVGSWGPGACWLGFRWLAGNLGVNFSGRGNGHLMVRATIMVIAVPISAVPVSTVAFQNREQCYMVDFMGENGSLLSQS